MLALSVSFRAPFECLSYEGSRWYDYLISQFHLSVEPAVKATTSEREEEELAPIYSLPFSSRTQK